VSTRAQLADRARQIVRWGGYDRLCYLCHSSTLARVDLEQFAPGVWRTRHTGIGEYRAAVAEVKATASRTVPGDPKSVYAALADYVETRPKLLSEHFSEYEVREGGHGAGTVVHWKLQATSKRVRDCLIQVSEVEPLTLVERDTNSSMVTTWKVTAAGDGGSTVDIVSAWQGATGVPGFFERTFAPLGLRRIYDAMLAKLDSV
jgi:hypothetical protein